MESPDKDPANNAQLERHAPISFSDLKGWAGDDHLSAFTAFCQSARRMRQHPYPARGALVDARKLAKCGRLALNLTRPSSRDAQTFFEDHFTPYLMGRSGEFDGFLTGYFEPEVSASPSRTDAFPVPLYRPPSDLADKVRQGEAYHLDRGAIQDGALNNQGLELAWLKDKTDAYFVHIQGSARLIMSDGEVMRVAYAGKTGHDYTSLGKALCQRLGLPPSEMTADVLADWMRGNPDEIDAFMAVNQSFIFFQELPALNPNDGPIGASEVPLTTGRSLAIDQQIHPYGVPIWLSTPTPIMEGDSGSNRLMIAQDTGSAITGPQRGDIFVGSGHAAGQIAGRIQSPARLTVLVPTP